MAAEDHFARLGQDPGDYILIRTADDAQGYRYRPSVDTLITLSGYDPDAHFHLTVK